MTEAPTPAPLARDVLAGLSGLELLQGMIAGRLPPPPFAATMTIGAAEATEGRVVFTGTPAYAYLNPLGTVHGGWIGTILDSAMACAVHSTLKAGQGYTTVSMTINYVRPLLADSGPVRCEGWVVHAGGRLATSEGRLLDGKGRLIAHGVETCLILSPEKA